MFWYILETRCTSTNCTRSGCTREAHVSTSVGRPFSFKCGALLGRWRIGATTCERRNLPISFKTFQLGPSSTAPQGSTRKYPANHSLKGGHNVWRPSYPGYFPCEWKQTLYIVSINLYHNIPFGIKIPFNLHSFFQFWVFFHGFWWRVWWKAVAGGRGTPLGFVLPPARERERESA